LENALFVPILFNVTATTSIASVCLLRQPQLDNAQGKLRKCDFCVRWNRI